MIKIKLKNNTLNESMSTSTANLGALVIRDKSFPGYDRAVQFVLIDINNLEKLFNRIREYSNLKSTDPIRPLSILKDESLRQQLFDSNEDPSSPHPVVIASVLVNTQPRKNCHRACEVVGSARHLKAARGSGRILYNMTVSWVSSNLKRPIMAQRGFVSTKAADVYGDLQRDSNFEKLPFQISSKYDYENVYNCYPANIQSGDDTVKASGDHPVNKAYYGDAYLGDLTNAEERLLQNIKKNCLGPANLLNWIGDVSYDLIVQGLSSNVSG